MYQPIRSATSTCYAEDTASSLHRSIGLLPKFERYRGYLASAFREYQPKHLYVSNYADQLRASIMTVERDAPRDPAPTVYRGTRRDSATASAVKVLPESIDESSVDCHPQDIEESVE